MDQATRLLGHRSVFNTAANSTLTAPTLDRTGMRAGVPKFVTINLRQLSEKFAEGETVSLDTLKAKRVLNVSGKEAKLPLKARPWALSPATRRNRVIVFLAA